MQEAHIVQKGTGEIIGELGKGDRIVRYNSIEHLKRRNVLVEGPETVKQFFKGNSKEIALILNELDVYEKAFLFSISPYVSYEDCCLKYGNGIDITTNDLIELTGLSRSKLFQVTESLLAKDIIYKGRNSKNRQYFVNPWIFCKGNNINKVLKAMFQNYRIRSMNNRRWKTLPE